MQETFLQTWNKLLLRCPALSPKLAQDFVVNAFRRIYEMRRWSWTVKFNQFIAPDSYNTGTVTVTQNSTTVTGSGTAWTAAMVGRQFRVGLAAPIYTIAQFTSATQIELDLVWGGLTASGAGYSIYQCYFTPQSDFHQFITLWDPAFSWQLFLDVNQSEINIWDAQRANSGNAYLVSFRGYSTSQVGIVNAPLAILGSGNAPLSSGTFLGPTNSIFTVEITTSGIPGVAVYRWKKNNGSYTSGVTTDASGFAQDLMDGVTISFPTGVSYTIGDIFIIQCTAVPNAGTPFYELWPHQQANHVYPYLYSAIPPDLNDPNAVLPRFIKSNFLVDLAIEDLALWPGPSADKQNVYYSLPNAAYYQKRNQKQIDTLQVQDDEIWMQDLTYQYPSVSWAFAVPFGDSKWLQNHAI